MALATQCPHCHTTFRVAQDQLKLRAGLVRCGHCKEIFNGIEHLLPPTAKLAPASSSVPPALAPKSGPIAPPVPTVPTAAPAVPPAAPHPDVVQAAHSAAVNAEPVSASAETETEAEAEPEPQPVETPAPAAPPPSAPERVAAAEPWAQEAAEKKKSEAPQAEARPDPLQRMTLVDFTHELPDDLETFTDYPTEQLSHAEPKAGDQPDELEEAIRDLQSKPWRREKRSARKRRAEAFDTDEEMEEEEPGFLKRGRRQQRLGRHLRLVYGLGSAVLLVAALLQGAYAFRNQLAGSFPQTKALLTQLCSLAGCRIDLPAQISSVSIESSELQTLPSAKNKFVLNSLLRNYSTTAQEWPYIELTLNDANEKPLLRRVFKPAEYLPNRDEVLRGFPPSSERAIKINFALSQIQASGYRVYLFYP